MDGVTILTLQFDNISTNLLQSSKLNGVIFWSNMKQESASKAP